MKKKCILAILLSYACSASSIEFSETSSITIEQANKILTEHKFNEKEIAYKNAFMNFETTMFDQIISAFYDPSSEGALSSKTKIKEIFVVCNIYSYQGYSENLRNVAFDIAYKGGSYADSKMGFDDALVEALADPDIGQEKMLSMVQGAGTILKLCTDNQGIHIF